jgi:anaerobic dimethyl sulfoxide reductase subunit A
MAKQVVLTVCHSHCGGACPLRVHVEDGVIRRIETDPEYRACLKGRAYRQRLYGADRLLSPLKRTGRRGDGEFTAISWDEALDTVAGRIRHVYRDYGPAALLLIGSHGDVVWLHHATLFERLLTKAGGYTGSWGSPSGEAGVFAAATSYGTGAIGNSRDDFLNSRLIILWGWNPVVSSHFGMGPHYLARARECGAKIVAVDPRCSDSAVALADQWIPIKPGSDTAMLIAMAQVILAEGLEDKRFIADYTHGFEKYADYVMGREDGVAKTPVWAEPITGVPAATTVALAREFATQRPASLMDGFAAGRSAYGEQFHRATIALAAMTGNIGVHGANPPGAGAAMGDHHGTVTLGPFAGASLQFGDNPVDTAAPPRPDAIAARKFGRGSSIMGSVSSARLHRSQVADALLRGRAGGYPADYKMLYVVNCNHINQMGDANHIAAALQKPEFIVVHEQAMTPMARFADIVLPINTYFERNDVTTGGNAPFLGYVNKAIEARGESRSPLQIAAELARRLGITDFPGMTEDEWLRKIVSGCPDVPDYEAFRDSGVHRVHLDEPHVCFSRQIADPAANRFPTASGKIEIYSEEIASLGNPLLPPIPTYLEPWEGPHDPLTTRFPLQLITTHPKRRAHSQFENVEWLREVVPQAVQINPADAGRRGIRSGDMVRVFNDRGAMVIAAAVTERIMPGVVDIPQGAWYAPDEKGVDRGGCANVLTSSRTSPAGAFCYNTCLVEVRKNDEVKH